MLSGMRTGTLIGLMFVAVVVKVFLVTTWPVRKPYKLLRTRFQKGTKT